MTDRLEPCGMLLISDGDMELCCCREVLDAIDEGELFCLRSQLFDLCNGDGTDLLGGGSSDVCPFCGARNLIRYGADGGDLNWETWYRDLKVYAEGMESTLSGLRGERDRLSALLGDALSATSGKGGTCGLASDLGSGMDAILAAMDGTISNLEGKVALLREAVDSVRENSSKSGWEDIDRQWE